MEIFPVEASISPLLGMLKIIKESEGEMSVSLLAEKTNEEVGNLLPLLDACTILGFAKVENGVITLTHEGLQLTPRTFKAKVNEKLRTIEPFKSTLEAIKREPLSTNKIATILKGKGIVLHEDMDISVDLLKHMLLVWGTRTKMLEYDAETDEWKAVK